jgi:arylsulfatase A-like enzyme
VVAVAVIGALACGGPEPVTGPPNFLLISIDALRADHLSSYGYDRATSPSLDRLAGNGVRFSRAFVNTHGTPPSHTTLLSSLYQETHRVGIDSDAVEGGGGYSIPDEVVLVQELFQEAGWLTVAVTGGGYMSAEFGFARGFEVFHDQAGGVVPATQQIVDILTDRNEDARPVFAFFHTYQVHSPYEPPEKYKDLFGEYAGSVEPSSEALLAIQNSAGKVLTRGDFEYLESLYDGEIRHTDTVIGRMLSTLEAEGVLDNTVVIVTADHGEEFGEHGGLLHGGKLFEELLRVPLIIAGRGVPRGVTNPNLVSLVDIAPTMLSLAGLPVPPEMEGRNLLDSTSDVQWPSQRIFAQYGNRLYCVRAPRWKLIHRPAHDAVKLFDLHRDPGERSNVRHRYPEITESLLDELRVWRDARPRLDLSPRLSGELSPEKIDELRALGYVE